MIEGIDYYRGHGYFREHPEIAVQHAVEPRVHIPVQAERKKRSRDGKRHNGGQKKDKAPWEQFWDWTQQTMIGMVGTVDSGVAQAGKAVMDVAGDVASGVGDVTSGIGGFFGNVASGIGDFFGGIKKYLPWILLVVIVLIVLRVLRE